MMVAIITLYVEDFNAHTDTVADVVHLSPCVLEDDDTDMRRMINV